MRDSQTLPAWASEWHFDFVQVALNEAVIPSRAGHRASVEGFNPLSPIKSSNYDSPLTQFVDQFLIQCHGFSISSKFPLHKSRFTLGGSFFCFRLVEYFAGRTGKTPSSCSASSQICLALTVKAIPMMSAPATDLCAGKSVVERCHRAAIRFHDGRTAGGGSLSETQQAVAGKTPGQRQGRAGKSRSRKWCRLTCASSFWRSLSGSLSSFHSRSHVRSLRATEVALFKADDLSRDVFLQCDFIFSLF